MNHPLLPKEKANSFHLSRCLISKDCHLSLCLGTQKKTPNPGAFSSKCQRCFGLWYAASYYPPLLPFWPFKFCCSEDTSSEFLKLLLCGGSRDSSGYWEFLGFSGTLVDLLRFTMLSSRSREVCFPRGKADLALLWESQVISHHFCLLSLPC